MERSHVAIKWSHPEHILNTTTFSGAGLPLQTWFRNKENKETKKKARFKKTNKKTLEYQLT